MYELLVAAGCVEGGRKVDFIPESATKSADIRAHDPFPLLIECKKQDAITQYELREEAAIRSIFASLRRACDARGISGTFQADFKVECVDLDQECVVEGALKSTAGACGFPWGTIAFSEIPQRLELSTATPIFSPLMLEEAFGWNSDLPNSDGICASFANKHDLIVMEVCGGVALTWVNTSEQAIRKKTWAPVSLLNQAEQQITAGEWGLIYIAYQEGARTDIADARLNAFRQRLDGWSHRGDVRIPVIFLTRLLPRTLGDGRPDLIENVLQLVSEAYGERELLQAIPGAVYTKAE